MADSASTRLRIRLQETGGNTNTWGILLDTALELLEEAIAGLETVAVTGGVSLTSSNYVSDQARNAVLKFTGTGDNTVTIPSVEKVYIVWNASTGITTVSTGSGDTVAIDTTDILLIFCDGTNVKTIGYGGLSLKAYIAAAVLTATGTLPATTGNEGKALIVRSLAATWDRLATTDLSDYDTNILGVQVALAFAASRRR
jgi:hypothetical protein